MATQTCIYCHTSSDLSKEHCLPRGLGNFRGHHVLHNAICAGCNSSISLCEDQFLHSGPEAFFRYMLGIRGRGHHDPIIPFYRGSAGADRITLIYPHPETGIEILWELDEGTEQMHELRQIVVETDDGQTLPMPLPPQISSAQDVRKELKSRGLEGAKPKVFSVPDSEWEHMDAVLREVWPGSNWKRIPNTAPDGRLPVKLSFSVTSRYFRAIAKIAFHYALAALNPVFTGDEPQFAAIRSFIMHGTGVPRSFVTQSPNQIVHGLGDNVTTKPWGHFLSVRKELGQVSADLQLFVGPGNLPYVYHVKIGRDPSRIFSPQARGDFYHYFEGGPKGGYDGIVDHLTPNVRIVVPSSGISLLLPSRFTRRQQRS